MHSGGTQGAEDKASLSESLISGDRCEKSPGEKIVGLLRRSSQGNWELSEQKNLRIS